MSELIRFDLEDGGSVVAVAAESEAGVVRASRPGSNAVLAAAATFEGSLRGVRDAATSALRCFRNIPQPPDEVSIEFGVQLSVQAGALIAQTAADGHLQVTLTWHRPTPVASGDPATRSDTAGRHNVQQASS